MKVCTKCKIEKSLDNYHNTKTNKSGKKSICKTCVSIREKNWRIKNEDRFKENRKKYYQKNIDKMRREKIEYYNNNKDQKAAYDLIYRQENKEKIAEHKRNWEKRNKDNPLHKIKRNLRRRVHHVVKDGYKSDSTQNLLGCSFEFFIQYIESLFLEGMSWDNYGMYGWHIDHIKPCSSFNLLDPEEQKKCFHYTNMQPLWWQDNLKKGKTIID